MVAKLGAKPRSNPLPRWAFDSAKPEHITAFNQEVERNLQERNMPEIGLTNIWDVLRLIYLEALERNIPKRKQLPRKPWITEDTFKFISNRSLCKEAGDLEKEADLKK